MHQRRLTPNIHGYLVKENKLLFLNKKVYIVKKTIYIQWQTKI